MNKRYYILKSRLKYTETCIENFLDVEKHRTISKKARKALKTYKTLQKHRQLSKPYKSTRARATGLMLSKYVKLKKIRAVSQKQCKTLAKSMVSRWWPSGKLKKMTTITRKP